MSVLKIPIAQPLRKLPLPAGVEQLRTRNGKIFFVDHINRKTTWIDPRDSPSRARDPAELPYGWTYHFDPVVGEYFMDNINMRSTKTDPRTGIELALPSVQHSHSRDPPPPRLLTADLLLNSAVHLDDVDASDIRGDHPYDQYSRGSLSEHGSLRSLLSAGNAANGHTSSHSRPGSSSRPASGYAVARDSAVAIADKLRAIKEEFEDNHSVLQQMREDVRRLVVHSRLYTTGRLQLDPSAARPLSRTSNIDLFRDLQDLRTYQAAQARRRSRRSHSPFDHDHPELRLDVHLAHLREFIEEQHDEVEALRRLQTGLMEGSARVVDPYQDPIAYRSLLQVMGRIAPDGPTHDEKIDYFDLLISTVFAEGDYSSPQSQTSQHKHSASADAEHYLTPYSRTHDHAW